MWIFASITGLTVLIALSSQQPPAAPAHVPVQSGLIPPAIPAMYHAAQGGLIHPDMPPYHATSRHGTEPNKPKAGPKAGSRNRKMLGKKGEKPIGEDVINAKPITEEEKEELKRIRDHFVSQFPDNKQKAGDKRKQVEKPSETALVVKKVLVNLILIFYQCFGQGPVKLESSRFGQQTFNFNNPGTAMNEYEYAKMLEPWMPTAVMIENNGIYTPINENEFKCHPSPNEKGVTKCELLHEQDSVKEDSKLNVYVDLNNDGMTMEKVAEVKVGKENNGACEMTEQGGTVGESCKPAEVVIKKDDIKNLKSVQITNVPVVDGRARHLQEAHIELHKLLEKNPRVYKLPKNMHSPNLKVVKLVVKPENVKNIKQKQKKERSIAKAHGGRRLLQSSPLAPSIITIVNNQDYPIWPGIQGDPLLEGGGLPKLEAGQSYDIAIPATWISGRIWARTGCDNGFDTCSSGKCGGSGVQCQGTGGEPPVSLVEFTKGAAATPDQTFYDISYVDGFNLGIGVEPENAGSNGDSCKAVPACELRSNPDLPAEMFKLDSGGNRYLVKSMCQMYTGTPDEQVACCSGAHATPDTCRSSWNDQMKNIYGIVKAACPNAYAFAYDDATSTEICQGTVNFKITFGTGITG